MEGDVWGMGLLDVVAALAMRKRKHTGGFDARILHQFRSYGIEVVRTPVTGEARDRLARYDRHSSFLSSAVRALA